MKRKRIICFFIIPFILTLGIMIIDKNAGRISGYESLLYPTITKGEEGDFIIEIFGKSNIISVQIQDELYLGEN